MSTYEMRIGLEALNHLGINLYSNTAAVISEVVANAWDADAQNVDINILSDQISILDDGVGMNVEDINNRFLYVGYDRRSQNQGVTAKFKRPVMGRKGIGKLSLFSISEEIEVQSMRKGSQPVGFTMTVTGIKNAIAKKKGIYSPDPLPVSRLTLNAPGTLISIRKLKRNIDRTEATLRKRVARRFSTIEAGNQFSITINGSAVSVDDRNYFNKLQYLWTYGSESNKYLKCVNTADVKNEKRAGKVGKSKQVLGWIGTVKNSGQLRDGQDSLNKISLFVRQKVAQEDLLIEYAEGGLYSKYLIGELHADFLDDDKLPDIATSNRQEIQKDDERYRSLKEWLSIELKYIQSRWTALRNEEGTVEATKNPAVASWYEDLRPDTKKKAEAMFGKINQLTIDEGQKKELVKQGILAFEILRYKDNLTALDSLDPENLADFTKAFNLLDDIESALYYQIISERLRVVETLSQHQQSNSLEKVIQKHLFDHLWLLDPSWERATETPSMELTIKKELGKRENKLTSEELKSRLDIKYKNPSQKHVIIELKRAGRQMESAQIIPQVMKYSRAMRHVIQLLGKNEPMEIIVLVGKRPSDWTSPDAENSSKESLRAYNARIILYQELIESAYSNYRSFLEANKDKSRVAKLLQEIDAAS